MKADFPVASIGIDTTDEDVQSGVLHLKRVLRERMGTFSRAERRLATYFINNAHGLHFETGASIARAVGVSEMTVSRFIRTIGFSNLRMLKKSLKPDAAALANEVDDFTARFQLRNAEPESALTESLRLELGAVAKAYALTAQKNWSHAVDELVAAEMVYVVGFQASKGLAMDFASRLLWIRPNVIFVNSDSGTFAEILLAEPSTSVVVLIDTAVYATRGLKIAERLKARGTPLVIITDKYSLWGWSYSKLVFEAHSYVKTFWDSTAGISVITNLMLDSVAARLGQKAKAHYQQMAEAVKPMGEFVSKHSLGRRE